MKHRLLYTALLALLISACVSAPRPTSRGDAPPPSSQIDPAAVDLAHLQRAIFDATNDARLKEGLGPVQHNPLLEKAASAHARRMVAHGFFSHEDPHEPSLKTPQNRAAATGVRNPLTAENLATEVLLKYRSGEPVYRVEEAGPGAFSRTPDGPLISKHSYASLADKVVARWLESPGHRANLLSSDAIELGCGADFYWRDGFPNVMLVQLFQLYEPVRGPAGL